MGERQEIIEHFTAELDHNEKWAGIHEVEGHPEAAGRRRDHCKKLTCWLEWLTASRCNKCGKANIPETCPVCGVIDQEPFGPDGHGLGKNCPGLV